MVLVSRPATPQPRWFDVSFLDWRTWGPTRFDAGQFLLLLLFGGEGGYCVWGKFDGRR